jgi:hypothetical protein
MTTVEVVFRFATPLNESVAAALADARDVYGIRRLSFDCAAGTLRVEYDATRLNVSTVAKLIREAGLEIAPEISVARPEAASLPAPQATPLA